MSEVNMVNLMVITSIKPYMLHVCDQRLPWSLKEVLENYL